MNILFAVSFAILTTFSLKAQESIEGSWNTGKENSVIELKEVNNTVTGTLQSSDNAKAKDIIGKLLVKDVKYTNGKWKGQIYVVRRQTWMNATFERDGSKLNVTVSAGWTSKTVEWTKAG